MNSPKRLLFILFVFLVPTSLLAQFVHEVRHDKIFKIAVERNVVTFFLFVSDTLNVRLRELGARVDYVVFEHDDHALINHHGHGVDGTYAPHQHVTYVDLSAVPPDLLNRLLMEAQLSDEERVRIMHEYANYFAQIPQPVLTQRPLRPGQREIQTPQVAAQLPRQETAQTPQVPDFRDQSQASTMSASLAFFLLLSMLDPTLTNL